MANTLTFTAALPVKNVTGATILRQRFDDEVVVDPVGPIVGEAVIDVQLTGASSTIWPFVYPLAIRNGSCDAVVPLSNPVLTTGIVAMERLSGGAGIATLFTDCFAASKATSGTIAGQTMGSNGKVNVLKILQAAVGNRFAGASPATATVLPPGAVT